MCALISRLVSAAAKYRERARHTEQRVTLMESESKVALAACIMNGVCRRDTRRTWKLKVWTSLFTSQGHGNHWESDCLTHSTVHQASPSKVQTYFLCICRLFCVDCWPPSTQRHLIVHSFSISGHSGVFTYIHTHIYKCFMYIHTYPHTHTHKRVQQAV